MASKKRVALCSHRLGGTDGVSIEVAKWQASLIALGHEVKTVGGSGRADVIIPALDADAAIKREEQTFVSDRLNDCFNDVDVVVVENICSLKLNEPAAELVADALHGRKAIFHHHDLAIERKDRSHLGPPPNDPRWLHVCISHRAQDDLRTTGIESITLYNHFDPHPNPGDRTRTRKLLNIGDNETLVLQPTRAIARKNIAAAIRIAESLDAIFWLLGDAEDGYDDELGEILRGTTLRVIRRSAEISDISIDDAYGACDLVTLTSAWEGFGNPAIESATHRRPLVIGDYPVAKELGSFGFKWFTAAKIEAIKAFVSAPDDALLDHNAAIAEQHFGLDQLPRKLEKALLLLDEKI